MRIRRGHLLVMLSLVAIVAGGCGGAPASMRTRVLSWANAQSYGAIEQNLNADLVDLHNGIKDHALTQLHTACEGFKYDLGSAYQILPAPDATVTNDLNVAISQYLAPGATLCTGATSITSRSYLTFLHDLALGTAVYNAAGRILHHDGVA